MSSLALRRLEPAAGFRPDPLLAGRPAGFTQPSAPAEVIAVPPDRYAEGYAAGERAARLMGEAELARTLAEVAAIELALTRFDEASAKALAEGLRRSVLTLCQEAILPAALDMEALAGRIENVVTAVRTCHEARRLVLNPQDLAHVRHRLPPDLMVETDAALERGSLRFEHDSGGVEDGPAHWRKAIAEALGECSN